MSQLHFLLPADMRMQCATRGQYGSVVYWGVEPVFSLPLTQACAGRSRGCMRLELSAHLAMFYCSFSSLGRWQLNLPLILSPRQAQDPSVFTFED